MFSLPEKINPRTLAECALKWLPRPKSVQQSPEVKKKIGKEKEHGTSCQPGLNIERCRVNSLLSVYVREAFRSTLG